MNLFLTSCSQWCFYMNLFLTSCSQWCFYMNLFLTSCSQWCFYRNLFLTSCSQWCFYRNLFLTICVESIPYQLISMVLCPYQLASWCFYRDLFLINIALSGMVTVAILRGKCHAFHPLPIITPRAHAQRGVKCSVVGGVLIYINLQFFWNQSFISQNTHFQSSISTQIGFSSNLMASGIA